MSGYSSIWVKINYPDNDFLILHEQYNKNAILPDGFVFAGAVKDANDEVPTESMQAVRLAS